MKVGDRLEKIATKKHYRLVEVNKNSGNCILKRILNGCNTDELIEIKSLAPYRTVYPLDNVINHFDEENSFLSNFYEKEFVYNNLTYKTAEHAFQAAKTNNIKEKENIKNQKTPSRAKFMGRRVKLIEDWEDIKVDIMYDICKAKFQDKDLKELLINTGNKKLVEGNTWGDDFWGVCNEEIGENNLGIILMKLREELKVS